MPDLLQQLQLDIAARLEIAAEFQYVPVLVNRPRDAAAATMIRETLNSALMGMKKYIARTAGQSDAAWLAACAASGKGGIACMVMMTDGEVPNDSPGPQFDLIATIRVFERPAFNEGTTGSGISAEQCALNIVSLLHLWSSGGNQLRCAKKAIKEGAAPEGAIAYDVTVLQHAGLQPRNAVARPVITDGPTAITIACATPGAAIYWTRDGTLPTPLNGTLYAAPFDDDTTDTLRAAAYKDGLAASDCARLALS